jgi:hypothetical protein
MSSIVSAVIGGQAQENVAQAQAGESQYQVNTEAATAGRGQDLQQGEFLAGLGEQHGEYTNTQNTANTELANAATGMADSSGIASGALNNEMGAIESGTTRTMQDTAKQVGANLATSGVRGGQAATLQNRAVGTVGLNAQENLDELLAQQAAATQAQQAGYNTALASGAMSKVGAS